MRFSTALAALFVLAAVPVAAAPDSHDDKPLDVPPNHWAIQSIQDLNAKKIMTTDQAGKFNGDKPVTRYELAVVVDRFVHYMEQGRQPLHATKANVTLKFPKDAPPASVAAIKDLVANRYIPEDSPLVKSPGNKQATANELSDLMAQVSNRIADRSLPPNSLDH